MSDNGKHRETYILRKGDDVIVDTEEICNVLMIVLYMLLMKCVSLII